MINFKENQNMIEKRRLKNIAIFSKLLYVHNCYNCYLVILIFSQFTSIHAPKNLENAPAQVLGQLRPCPIPAKEGER